MHDLAHKKILIVGYGKEGKATEKFVQKMVPTASYHVTDVSSGQDYLQNQHTFDVAIKSPGVKKDSLTIPYTTATNIFFSLVQGMTIGVTGTKGKSTTASLIYDILKEAGKNVHLVGNIGNPMLTELLKTNTQKDIWVCELSSYQLQDIAYSPHIAVVTSLFPEHMNYHGSVEAYYSAKARIIALSTNRDFVVYDKRNTVIGEFLEETKALRIPAITTLPFPDSVIPLLGKHNKSNVALAVTVAQLLEIPDKVIEKAVANFSPLAHRLQRVGIYKDIIFYDDAISTTPQSTIAALEALPKVGTLFLGGEDRGYDFEQLVDEVAKRKIPTIVLFPESGKIIQKLLQQKKLYKPTLLGTCSMQEAVEFAYKHTPKKTICLLSCASPSYSIWKNFEEKGDAFQQWVQSLSQ